MVEQEAVNFEVAGSSPAVGAKHKHYDESHGVFVFIEKLYNIFAWLSVKL